MDRSYYRIITADVMYDKELTSTQKLLFAEITALTNEKGYCYATNTTLGERFHITDRAVRNALHKLKEQGHITVDITKNKAGTFRKIYIKLPTGRNYTSYGGGNLTSAQNNNITNKQYNINNSMLEKFESIHFQLFREFEFLLKANNPNAKTPDENTKTYEKWLNSIRLLNKKDGYSYEDIKKVMVWCQKDEFWKCNILSLPKLREKFGQLYLKVNKKKQTYTQETREQNKQKLKEWC